MPPAKWSAPSSLNMRAILAAVVVLIVLVVVLGVQNLHYSVRGKTEGGQGVRYLKDGFSVASTTTKVSDSSSQSTHSGAPPGSEPFVSWFPADIGGESDKWKPIFVSTCTPSMPRSWAPCMKSNAPNLELAEEVIYPDFTLRVPNFVSEDDRRRWLRMHKWRIGGNDSHGIYTNQHGQNLMFQDAEYNGEPKPSTWSPTECMLKGVTTNQFVTKPGKRVKSSSDVNVDSVVFLATPFDWSFTHFMDRTAHMLAQSEAILMAHKDMSLLRADPDVVTVKEMYDTLPMTAGHPQLKPRAAQVIHAKHLLFPCRTPLVHPYGSLRPIDSLFKAHGLERNAVPLEERKTVFVLTRKGAGVKGGGKSRVLTNEDEMVKQIKELLLRRGQGEVLKVFDHEADCKGHLKPCMELFSREARALVGGHGSAFGNLRFCGKGTLVLEVVPVQDDGSGTLDYWWEETGVFNLPYWHVFGTGTASGGAADAPIPLIIDVLDKHLGNPNPVPSLLPLYWQWDLRDGV